jgi:hypothetical protein
MTTYTEKFLIAATRARAYATAKSFAEEFPGESISGDWDAEAWVTDLGSIERFIDLVLDEPALYDLAWDTYRTELHRAVAELSGWDRGPLERYKAEMRKRYPGVDGGSQ